jgi:hypothetical protein
MPKRKVVFSGLLAFGAGVAVGANWPRAGNFVGYLLQRLGFELTDLSLWIWDPEKSLAQTKVDSPEPKAKSKKKTPHPLIQTGNPPVGGGKAKRKDALGPRNPSATARRTKAKSANDADQPWILSSRPRQSLNNEVAQTRSKSGGARLSLTKLDDSAIGTARRKSKAASKKGEVRRAGIAGKTRTFRRTVVPANAALN